jgi:hypothetical protein
MLPPWIVDQLRERERAERDRREQPQLELPLPPAVPRDHGSEPDSERGVTEIQVWD